MTSNRATKGGAVYVDGPDEKLDKESQSTDDEESPGKPLVDEPTEPALNPDEDDFGAASKEAGGQ